jgi:hypothetical protein
LAEQDNEQIARAALALRDALQLVASDEADRIIGAAYKAATHRVERMRHLIAFNTRTGFLLPNKPTRSQVIKHLNHQVEWLYQCDLVPSSMSEWAEKSPETRTYVAHSRGYPNVESLVWSIPYVIYLHWQTLGLPGGRPSLSELEKAIRDRLENQPQRKAVSLLERVLQAAMAAAGYAQNAKPSRKVQNLTKFLKPKTSRK